VGEGLLEAYGRALAAVGKPGQAVDQFLAAEALVGRRADLDDDIGSLYAQQGKWPEARERFEHAISMDPTFVRGRIHLGVLFREQNDLENSLATLQAACALEPPSAEAMLEYGRSLAAAGKDDEAIQQFTEAMKLNAGLPGVQFELAMALQ